MAVPNTFATDTGTIPLSDLDANFSYYDAGFSLSGANITYSGTTTAGNLAFTWNITTAAWLVGNAQTTGTIIFGGTAGTGAMTFGRSTGAQTLNFGTGATTNGTTKTINIGTAGVSGSITTINIGSAVSGATGATIINSNVGIGVTPSAWAANTKAIQLGPFSTGYGALFVDDSGNTNLIENGYESASGVKRYVSSSFATNYKQVQSLGQHQWFIAPSGTAGNTITFTQAMTLDASGQLLVGTTADQTGAKIQSQLVSVSRTTSLVPMISASSGGSNCGLLLTTNSTSTRTAIVFENDSGAATVGSISTSGSATSYNTSTTSGLIGAGADIVAINTASTERMRIDSSGNVLVKSAAGLGYGTGSGGAVTQATSKVTGVTLNKPTGQITMNNAALAGGASVIFALTNSLIAATDTVILSHSATAGTANAYVTQALTCGAGSVTIRVTNITAGSLSEAAIINFSIIKGATS